MQLAIMQHIARATVGEYDTANVDGAVRCALKECLTDQSLLVIGQLPSVVDATGAAEAAPALTRPTATEHGDASAPDPPTDADNDAGYDAFDEEDDSDRGSEFVTSRTVGAITHTVKQLEQVTDALKESKRQICIQKASLDRRSAMILVQALDGPSIQQLFEALPDDVKRSK